MPRYYWFGVMKVSVIDQAGDAFAGSTCGGRSGELIQMILHLINHPQIGGLSGLVTAFEQRGLAELARSWVSAGQNLLVDAPQIQLSLAGPALRGFAEQLGMNHQEAAITLAQLLPLIVDNLTPDGCLPERQSGDELLAKGLEMLKKGGLI